MGDAVPMAADFAECIVEFIAAQHQYQQTVGMSESGCGQQVCGARSGACRTKDESTAQVILGIGGRSETHTLLVLPAVKRQVVTHRIERLAQTGDIAMAEYPKTATTDPDLGSIDLDELIHQKPHNGLRDGQPDTGTGT